MMNITQWLIRINIFLLSSTLLAGCDQSLIKALKGDQKASGITTVSTSKAAEGNYEHSDTEQITPAPISNVDHSTHPQSIATNTPHPSDNAVHPASHIESDTAEDTKLSSPISEAFDSQSPSLMGIHIGDKQNTIQAKYNTPNDSYVMEDPDDPITVYVYDYFTVGFSQSRLVIFVNVTSDQAVTGLNGLRLGQTVEDAAAAIGESDTNTSFVLSYHYDKAVLKLDIDPKARTIQSIKLFGRDE